MWLIFSKLSFSKSRFLRNISLKSLFFLYKNGWEGDLDFDTVVTLR